MNNDDIFLAYTLENGLLEKDELFDAGVGEWDYFNLNDDIIDKLEGYFSSKKK